tara:strand:- start:13587 stop:13910 length:324 start_codon:yes stop_codon:yes gene_type:complete
MKTLPAYYEVMYNSDGMEGKGRTLSTGIKFDDEDSAVRFVMSERYRRYAGMGGPPTRYKYAQFCVRRVEESQVYDSVAEYDEATKAPDLTGQTREIDGRRYKLVLAE